MGDQGAVAAPRAAGMLLVLSFVASMAGVVLFSVRDGTSGKPAPNFAYLALERSLFVGAAVIAALGLVALAATLGEAQRAARVPALAAAATYVVATVALVVAEANGLRSDHPPYAPIVAYVVAAFLAQAAFGIILLRTGFLPAWVGWAAIVWNLGWLVALPLTSPGDIYFPALHHPIPLAIGIALLRRGDWRSTRRHGRRTKGGAVGPSSPSPGRSWTSSACCGNSARCRGPTERCPKDRAQQPSPRFGLPPCWPLVARCARPRLLRAPGSRAPPAASGAVPGPAVRDTCAAWVVTKGRLSGCLSPRRS